jgi:hypothetical protein
MIEVGLHAVHHGHREVEQHDIWLQRLSHEQCLLTVAGSPDDLEVVLGLEQEREQLTKVGSIVHDEHAVALNA